MGIPKFYRWISERYPCLSEKVKEYQIPEFDNLYLDMNGIIHTCSHPNDEDIHLRIPEHDVFRDIFRYLDFLFKMIKPRKIFFMAVDGVAPRAKMNQQRGRRFRSAQEAEDKEEEARRKGEVLPTEARFDSNCITPGTAFMARLHDQLKYFVQVKVSTDPLWQRPGLAIILSGHDVPGEGEHKIMDYIRHIRSDPAYDPETRHCLYGLDADLIMLGLSTHELRFSLLREEVKFGRQRTNKKRKTGGYPATGGAPKPFDFTNVSIYVKNGETVSSDSITELKNTSTVVDGKSYSETLQTQPAATANEVESDNAFNVDALLAPPTYEGLKTKDTFRPPLPEKTTFYLLHLSLLRDYIDEEFKGLREALEGNSQISYDLENIIDDWVLLNILVGNDFVPHLPHLHIVKGALPKLYGVYTQVLPTLDGYLNENGYLNLPRFEAFLRVLSVLDIEVFRETFDDMVYLENKTGKNIVLDKVFEGFEFNGEDGFNEEALEVNGDDLDPALKSLISRTDEILNIKPETGNELEQVFTEYDKFMIEEDNPKFRKEYLHYKRSYYQEKMNVQNLSSDTLNRFTEEYVRAVQWILLYYYKGVSSWGWFYPYHYAPFTSDLKDFSEMKIEFDLGEPFKPFEQLLGVLPAQSKNLLPAVYHDLMTAKDSPIARYYPDEFESDLNGKKQSWEAVVLIPFIDEKLLLDAMTEGTSKLTKDELLRNSKGVVCSYRYIKEESGSVHSPGNIFPSLPVCHALESKIHKIPYDPKTLPKGIHPHAKRDAIYQGFPTLKSKPYLSEVTKADVKVFDFIARDDSLVLHMQSPELDYVPRAFAVTKLLIGKDVWVNWPHLTLGLVTAVSDEETMFKIKNRYKVERDPSYNAAKEHPLYVDKLKQAHKKFKGIILTDCSVIIWAKTMEGRKVRCDSQGKVIYDNQWSQVEQPYPLQTVIDEKDRVLAVGKDQGTSYKEYYSVGQKVFALQGALFGHIGTVLGHDEHSVNVIVEFKYTKDTLDGVVKEFRMCNILRSTEFYNGHQASQMCGISINVFSRLTGSVFVAVEKRNKINGKRQNKEPKPGVDENSEETSDSSEELELNQKTTTMSDIGLKLKFNKKSMEIRGYTRKVEDGWFYSFKTVKLVGEFCEQFPEVIKYLNQSNLGRRDSYLAKEIFPDSSNENVKKIMDWIDAKGIRQLEQVPLNSQILDEDDIDDIWKHLVKIEHSEITHSIQKVCRLNPCILFKPGADSGCVTPLPDLGHDILDRVVCVDPGAEVPLGHRGTIVGIMNPVETEVETAFSIASETAVQHLVVLCDPLRDQFEVAVDKQQIDLTSQLCNVLRIGIGGNQSSTEALSNSTMTVTKEPKCILKKLYPFQVLNLTKNESLVKMNVPKPTPATQKKSNNAITKILARPKAESDTDFVKVTKMLTMKPEKEITNSNSLPTPSAVDLASLATIPPPAVDYLKNLLGLCPTKPVPEQVQEKSGVKYPAPSQPIIRIAKRPANSEVNVPSSFSSQENLATASIDSSSQASSTETDTNAKYRGNLRLLSQISVGVGNGPNNAQTTSALTESPSSLIAKPVGSCVQRKSRLAANFTFGIVNQQ